VLQDGYLKIEASCLVSTASEEQLKEMIQEEIRRANQRLSQSVIAPSAPVAA